MSFSQEVKMNAMVACGRRCSLCHKFCGINIEVHHIKQEADGGQNTSENAIPLCFDCHANVKQYDPKHPKGNKFTEQELMRHRDNWYKKVEENSALITSPEYRDIDINTYKKLKEFLPEQLMEFVRDIDLHGGSYKRDCFRPFVLFSVSSDNPIYEYIDPDLETIKMALKSSIDKFFSDCVPCIHCEDCINCRIPMEWEILYPDKFDKYAKQLNEDTFDIWYKYCDYIKLCRRKLVISGE